MTFDSKKYMREWRRKKRAEEYAKSPKMTRGERMLKEGKCPVCEMLLDCKYHTNCSYIDKHVD